MYYLSGGLGMPVQMKGCKFNYHVKILSGNPSPSFAGKVGFSILTFLIYSTDSRLHTRSDLSWDYKPVDLHRMTSNT